MSQFGKKEPAVEQGAVLPQTCLQCLDCFLELAVLPESLGEIEPEPGVRFGVLNGSEQIVDRSSSQALFEVSQTYRVARRGIVRQIEAMNRRVR